MFAPETWITIHHLLHMPERVWNETILNADWPAHVLKASKTLKAPKYSRDASKNPARDLPMRVPRRVMATGGAGASPVVLNALKPVLKSLSLIEAAKKNGPRRVLKGFLRAFPALLCAVLPLGCYTKGSVRKAFESGVQAGSTGLQGKIAQATVDMILLKQRMDELNHQIVVLSDEADKAKKKYDELRTFKFDDPLLPDQPEPYMPEYHKAKLLNLPTFGGTAQE